MKTPANHPWKSSFKRKVKAECRACKKVFDREVDGGANTCSHECEKAYKKVKWISHLVRGGFR